jgi:hypothetical protein
LLAPPRDLTAIVKSKNTEYGVHGYDGDSYLMHDSEGIKRAYSRTCQPLAASPAEPGTPFGLARAVRQSRSRSRGGGHPSRLLYLWSPAESGGRVYDTHVPEPETQNQKQGFFSKQWKRRSILVGLEIHFSFWWTFSVWLWRADWKWPTAALYTLVAPFELGVFYLRQPHATAFTREMGAVGLLATVCLLVLTILSVVKRYHDVIEAEPETAGTLRFISIVTPSGLKTVARVLPKAQIESPTLSVLLNRVIDIVCFWERVFEWVLLVRLPPTELDDVIGQVNSFFSQQVNAGKP